MIFFECWLLGPSQWSVGFFQLRFAPWLKLLLTQLCLLSAQTSQSTIITPNHRKYCGVLLTLNQLNMVLKLELFSIFFCSMLLVK